MTKSLVVVGYGPGVSTAVAEKFGAEGFQVALVARGAERLAAGVAALAAKGVKAVAIPADAGDVVSIRSAIQAARGALGPITVIHWNAFGGQDMPDLMEVDATDVGAAFDVAVVGLLAAVQEALPDLVVAGDGAVLVTNGALGLDAPMMDQLALALPAMGVALGNAAKRKLVGMLAAKLAPEGVYVGEVTIAGAVKGTPFAAEGGIEGATIAEAFWKLYRERGEIRAQVS
jgi:NAD(P)-dependent dehydrogenase (short-subunit alcohol dehydrogenase family)